MKKIFLGFTFLTILVAVAAAQEKDAETPQILLQLAQTSSGQVEIIQPEQLITLLKMQIANNRLQRGIPGYRIRIYSQSGQTALRKCEDTRREFLRNFPEMEAHWEYNTPNFQVFVGDFRTKNEALREKKRIEKIFPGAFIVSAVITTKK